ncbi:hypothetical protein WR25_08013 [Diploscapter pachys]|uniref:Importin N-terminal domain-containing protein n=1 Tax=Diploscapter pachys TaxID=2018661 RepID=A0A2A2LYP5_9BILA|nr:hypothetical protein WR25_08013 [Diploscapter pachys]
MVDIEKAAQQLLSVLEKTVSQNPQDQKAALDFLEQAAVHDFPTFVQCLAIILNTGACQSFVRQAAGIQLKNALSAKDDETRNTCIQRWISLPEATRISIKQHVMGTLGTEPYHPSIAAQCVKAIACAELPTGLWPDVISLLMGNVPSPQSGEMLKKSSLEALGYICQEIDANVGLETTALQAYSLETS